MRKEGRRVCVWNDLDGGTHVCHSGMRGDNGRDHIRPIIPYVRRIIDRRQFVDDDGGIGGIISNLLAQMVYQG